MAARLRAAQKKIEKSARYKTIVGATQNDLVSK
jgi:hypothetical protein